jgi:hypothetical protein
LTMQMITIKVIAERTKQYVAWVQFLLILYLFIAQSPFSVWLVVPTATIALLVISYIDYRFILPAEFNKSSKLNPFMVEIRDDIQSMKRELQSVKKELERR